MGEVRKGSQSVNAPEVVDAEVLHRLHTFSEAHQAVRDMDCSARTHHQTR